MSCNSSSSFTAAYVTSSSLRNRWSGWCWWYTLFPLCLPDDSCWLVLLPLERWSPDANLSIELTFGMAIPSQPIHLTHEHEFRDIPLSFTCSIRQYLVRDEVVVCIDIGHIEPFFINMYVVVHIDKLLSPWIHKGLYEIQTCDLFNVRQERLHCVGMSQEPSFFMHLTYGKHRNQRHIRQWAQGATMW